MDLSLIRKMILARKVQSYADLHQYVGLISHNCVKYYGRETDYGMVAREFEAMADEFIRQAVTAAENAPKVAPTEATTSATAVVAATLCILNPRPSLCASARCFRGTYPTCVDNAGLASLTECW
jgi:hypothetical protein